MTAIQITVAMIVAEMSREQMLAQRMALLLDSPHEGRYGHDKIMSLLTQDNGTKMHEDTAAAFLMLTAERLGID